MNSPMVGLRVASAVFGLVFLGQLARLLLRLKVTVGPCVIPLWCSGVALVVAAVLCVWLWRLSLVLAKPVSPGSPPAAT